jgi:NDP-sugar pyrophosphorylase family protein
MKAIIPVAGAGTKLRPHSYTQPKALIPLAGKTVLSIIIDQMREAGIQEFIFIVGYLGDKIRDYVQLKYPDIQATYVQQIDRQGIGHTAGEGAKGCTRGTGVSRGGVEGEISPACLDEGEITGDQ